MQRALLGLAAALLVGFAGWGYFWREVAHQQLEAFAAARVEDSLSRAAVLDAEGRECPVCPGDRSGRLLCCTGHVSLDTTSTALLSAAFNFDGSLGEHDRLLKEAAKRFGGYDRWLFDADERSRACERRLIELEPIVRRLERSHRRRS